MDENTLNWTILGVTCGLLQLVAGWWSWSRTRSALLLSATLVLPPIGLPAVFFKLRGGLKDNQVAGLVTYLAVLAGIAFFLWKLPADEVPWMVIFTMLIFAALGVINMIDLAVRMR